MDMETPDPAPRYSMLKKWQRRIAIGSEALLAADPSEATAHRAAEFTANLIDCMKRDIQRNPVTRMDSSESRLFLHDDDQKAKVEVLKFLHQTFAKIDRSASNGSDLLFPHLNASPDPSSTKQVDDARVANMQIDIIDIVRLVTDNSTYDPEFEAALELQANILSVLFRSDHIPEEDWTKMEREDRIKYLNEKAVAADYLVRKLLPYELPDRNNTTQDKSIVDPYALPPDQDQTGTHYAKYLNGKVYFVSDDEFDATAKSQDACGFLVHELTHRLSDILSISENFKYEQDIRLQDSFARKMAERVLLRGISDDNAHRADVVKELLYVQNTEEICARKQEARVRNNCILDTPEAFSSLAKQMHEALLGCPPELQQAAENVKQLMGSEATSLVRRRTQPVF